jgi:MSHA biogenesis protein MshP
MMSRPSPFTRQRGLGAILAVVIVVMLSVLASALVRLSWSSQSTAAANALSARARQAAKAGAEWGLYQALRSNACAASSTIDLHATNGMWVNIACSSTDYTEGVGDDGSTLRTVRLYTIVAVACNSGTACPDASRVTQPGYVEREARVSATSLYTQP